MPAPLFDFAKSVHSRLRQHGYEAYFVGGCVRDTLLGVEPKDYDIATNALASDVMRLFPGSGEVGAHFGVVQVRDERYRVEVATYRGDGAYSDGRRPDSVSFVSDVRHDVERRDFTINAMLLDPATGEVLDLVGGQRDLRDRVLRAIGDPRRRFEEDHLRLLRAIRFAARLDFTIEPTTFAAMRACAGRIQGIAVERVREELTRILMEGGAARGLELLGSSGLTEALELRVTADAMRRFRGKPATVAVAWAALLLGGDLRVLERLRHSSADAARIAALVRNHGRMDEPFATLAERKRFLRLPSYTEQLALQAMDGRTMPVEPYPFTNEELNPLRLLAGDDLIALGWVPGPAFKTTLTALEDAQLNGEVRTRAGAFEWLRQAKLL